MFRVIPNYISDEIDRKLDAEIEKHPNAASDRAVLRSQLLDYVDKHGVVPDFSLALKPRLEPETEADQSSSDEPASAGGRITTSS